MAVVRDGVQVTGINRQDNPGAVRPYLELLLRDGFGKENIDGEALDWAARRLAARPKTLKILMVLCDGVPFDSATGQAHDRSFLETHLRR